MAEVSRVEESVRLSATALEEWSGHVECVLRGIAHALNNRAAALSAVIELSQDPADEPATTRAILATELARVQGLTAVVRSLGAPRSGAEAFGPGDAALEALAVLEMHSEHRNRTVSIDAGSAPPVRMPRWMYVRALIVMGATVSRTTGDIKITVAGDGDWVVARVEGAGAPSAGLTPYVTELARAMGGEPLAERYGFRVPTLVALRQREGRSA
ncbi:MAG: hypothetical protein WD825_06455 [Gemmatimonadaceae bacterium]